ncbi:MAG: L-histidine N(alpha)-methyltransferase, partial [Lysobacteraceae bacterium]
MNARYDQDSCHLTLVQQGLTRQVSISQCFDNGYAPDPCPDNLELTDLYPTPDDITRDTLTGLTRSPKRLPSKYFYDARGSQLFEAITRLPEYYPTRTEIALMQARLHEIANAIGQCAHVVEYGSGS